jgi:catechol 2,3-dioxygenase-like lactoylglutathione lyase family enzyme
MLLYTTIGTNDIARATAFWDPVMESLGQARLQGIDQGWAGWGQDYDGGFGFYLCPPYDGEPARAGNGLMLAFPARDAAHVRALHALALAHGGTDEGAPGTRPYYEPGFYVAYVRDPDGHKVAFVFHRYRADDDTP